jgi:magnesium transporter
MPDTPIAQDQLYDPIVNHVRPAPLILRPDDTLGDALEKARALPATQIILYCYVVDERERLVGVVPIRRLLTSASESRIADVMIAEVVAIPSWATVLVAAEYFVNRRFLAFPVVEADGRLVGVVDVTSFTDEVLALAKQSFDGIFQLIGVHATQALTPWSSYKDRFPWLLCNVGGGLLCAFILSRYEETLEVAVVLALFIPVVLALAESVSIQSVTLTLQNLQSGKVQWRSLFRALTQEAATAVMLGISCGALIGLAAWAWQRSLLVGGILTGAIAASVVIACLLGVVLPNLLRAAKKDPQIAAGPIVLALTDVTTLVFYFSVAALLLRH